MKLAFFLLFPALSLGQTIYLATCPPDPVVNQPIVCTLSLFPPAYFNSGNASGQNVTITSLDDGVTLEPNPTGGNTWYPSIGQTYYNFVFVSSTSGIKRLHFTNGQGWNDPVDVPVNVISSSCTASAFPASLTPVIVQSVACPSDANVTAWSCSITPKPGNTVIVGVELYNAASGIAIPAIVDNLGHSFTVDDSVAYHYNTIYQLQAILRLKAAPGMTGFTVTRPNASYSLAIAMEVANLADNPVDVIDPTGNDTHDGCCWISGPLVTTNDHDLIVGFAATADGGANPPGAGTGWTLAANAFDVVGGQSASMIYRLTPSGYIPNVNPGYYLPTGQSNLATPRGHYALALAVAYKAALDPTDAQRD